MIQVQDSLILFFFFNRLCNPRGFWSAQLSLSILSRKVFTECRCQRHVKPPNLEDQWLERSKTLATWSPQSLKRRKRAPAAEGGTMGEKFAENFAESGDFHVTFWVPLYAVNLRHGTDGFSSPPKEEALRNFSPEKSVGFGPVWNPRIRVPKAGTLTSRPPKPRKSA